MNNISSTFTNEIKTILKGFGSDFTYVIYTALYGNVDQLHDPLTPLNENILYVCFTDRKDLKSDKWNVIYQEGISSDDRVSAKYWKFFGYIGFQDKAKYIIWVDASIKIVASLLPLLKDISQKSANSSIFTFRHPKRNCIYSELLWVFMMGKESSIKLIKTWLFLKKNSYSCGNGLIAGTIIIRKTHSDKEVLLESLMNEWWSCVKNYSTRDQLTFNYLIQNDRYEGLHSYMGLTGSVYDCDYFQGVRKVKFDSKINPSSKTNFRHKFFHLFMSMRGYIKKKYDNR